MKKRHLATLCLTIVASVWALGQNKAFTSEFFGFSASFTHVPEEVVMDRNVKIEGREMLIKSTQFISWDKRGVGYIVGAFSFPFSIQTDEEISAYLKSSQASMIKRNNGRLLQSTPKKLQGLSGTEFRYEFEQDGDTYTAYFHSVVVKTRAFNIGVIAPKGTAVSAERERFLKSFKLTW